MKTSRFVEGIGMMIIGAGSMLYYLHPNADNIEKFIGFSGIVCYISGIAVAESGRKYDLPRENTQSQN